MTNKGIPSYDDKLRYLNIKIDNILNVLYINGTITREQYVGLRDVFKERL